MAAPSVRRTRRQRGSIEELPSGGLRVSVYAGTDPLTGRRHYLRESIPASPSAHAEAQKALHRLANQVDERRNPRTNATVDQLLDRHFELAELEVNTVANYRSLAEKHIRPLIGSVKVGALDGDLFDSFYAELRRCRDHCGQRQRIDHRTDGPHQCDNRRKAHQCRPLSNGSIRYIHFILSGALKRAVRWRWIATNPIAQAVPPPQPKLNPQPPTAEQAARILSEAWQDPDWAMLIWLTMVTGFRRGELCAIRWRHLELAAGVLMLERSIGQRSGRTWEKDTKTHQHRRIALDPETLSLLSEHRQPAPRHLNDDPQAAPLLRHRADLRGRRRPHGGWSARARWRGNDDAQGLRSMGVRERPARGHEPVRPATRPARRGCRTGSTPRQRW